MRFAVSGVGAKSAAGFSNEAGGKNDSMTHDSSISLVRYRAEARLGYKKVVVETPRVSLGNKSPEPTPTLDQYTSWLVAEYLFDALLK